MTDAELTEAIDRAVGQPEGQGLAALVALRDRVQAERAPADPAVERVWDALVEVAGRSPDDVAAYLRHAEGRARWLAAVRGPAHPATIKAWSQLGDAADTECAWDVASRAWEAIAAEPLDGAAPEGQAMLSAALRGLGARRSASGRLDEARRLFERDLTVTERLYPAADAQVALALGNLASVLERLGALPEALQLRERQRDALAAGGEAPGLVTRVEADIARLRAAVSP